MHSHAPKDTKSVNISKMNLKTEIVGKPYLSALATNGEINWDVWHKEIIGNHIDHYLCYGH